MSEKQRRRYILRVLKTFVFYDDVQVEASTQWEARARAVESFLCNWSQADHVGTRTVIVFVEEPDGPRTSRGLYDCTDGKLFGLRRIARGLALALLDFVTRVRQLTGSDPGGRP